MAFDEKHYYRRCSVSALPPLLVALADNVLPPYPPLTGVLVLVLSAVVVVVVVGDVGVEFAHSLFVRIAFFASLPIVSHDYECFYQWHFQRSDSLHR